MSRKNKSLSLKLPDPVKTVVESMTIRTADQEKVFFSNDNSSIEGRIRAFLESEYPRFFDPLNPISFSNIEGDLLKKVKEIENALKSRLDYLVGEIKKLEFLNTSLTQAWTKTATECAKAQEQVDALLKEIDRLDKLSCKLMTASIWTRLKFVFFDSH